MDEAPGFISQYGGIGSPSIITCLAPIYGRLSHQIVVPFGLVPCSLLLFHVCVLYFCSANLQSRTGKCTDKVPVFGEVYKTPLLNDSIEGTEAESYRSQLYSVRQAKGVKSGNLDWKEEDEEEEEEERGWKEDNEKQKVGDSGDDGENDEKDDDDGHSNGDDENVGDGDSDEKIEIDDDDGDRDDYDRDLEEEGEGERGSGN
ncbi:uncharacterized protein [Penaeus vannamei]|uniref:uncharacterized protein n=1 Tax=Penaeus vannamei TaxID=6689 RepID=UPI00387F5A7A